MPYLRQLLNEQVVSIHLLETATVWLGRSGQCEIVIDDPTVSAVHARIEWLDGRYVLTDESSTNGIHLDGVRVERLELEPGARFTIGTRDFELLKEVPVDLERTLKIKKSWIPGVYYTE